MRLLEPKNGGRVVSIREINEVKIDEIIFAENGYAGFYLVWPFFCLKMLETYINDILCYSPPRKNRKYEIRICCWYN